MLSSPSPGACVRVTVTVSATGPLHTRGLSGKMFQSAIWTEFSPLTDDNGSTST